LTVSGVEGVLVGDASRLESKTSAGLRSELVGVGVVRALLADDDADEDADDVVDDAVDGDAVDAPIEEASRVASLTSITPDRKPTAAVVADEAVERNPPRGGGDTVADTVVAVVGEGREGEGPDAG